VNLKRYFLTCLLSTCLVLMIIELYHEESVKEFIISIFSHPLIHLSYKQSRFANIQQENCNISSNVSFEIPDLYKFDSILQSTEDKLLGFLLETSEKDYLTVRQGCAVESCVKFSGRICILLTLSKVLNLCDKKVYTLLQVPNVLVLHLNTSLLIQDNPLANMFSDGRAESSCCKTIHFSDIFRLAILYRYGGWYTDTDTVTIKDTTSLKNTVALSGPFAANGNLIFQKGYGFLKKIIQKADSIYTGKGWNSLGPYLLTETIRNVCHVGHGTNHSLHGFHKNCFGLTVLNHSSFYPVMHPQRFILFQTQTDQFWQSLFNHSYSVHFYGSNTSGRRGWLTGKDTAYDYLGKNFCPAIYSLQNNMDLWI